MTSSEARRIGQLNAELAVAMKALDKIAQAVDLEKARGDAGNALKMIRSENPKDWEQAYLLGDLLETDDLTKEKQGLLI